MGNQPDKKFVAGAISATVWENTAKKDDKEFSFYTVSLQRAYTDKDGNWQNTSSMRVNDLPKARVVLGKAYEYLTLKDVEKKEE